MANGDVYAQLRVSSKPSEKSAFGGLLVFFKVEDGGRVVMFYNTDRMHLVRANVGEYLKGDFGELPFKILSASSERQEVIISYLAATDPSRRL
ncbi:hypothetical protein EBZ70_06785 [bacterium]|nr:hypothetical protein [bacterium]